MLRKFRKIVQMALSQPKGFWHFVGSFLSSRFKAKRVMGGPTFITIEPTNHCDLGCPVCETGAKILGRHQGHMTVENFKKILKQIRPHTNAIQLYFMGESFLNKHIYEMIALARKAGIPFVNIYSNGSVLDSGKCVQSGLNEINFNIGGMTQETHATYRINSNLERVKNNIQALSLARQKKSGAETNGHPLFPKINVGMIVMKHNEHEVEQFLKEVPGWGADRAHLVDPCFRTMAQAVAMIPEDRKYWFYDEQAFEQGELKPKVIPKNRCDWIYFSSVITWDGQVVPCCHDPTGKYVMGNVFEEDFGQIWNGQKYQSFRKQIRTDQGKLSICKLCSSYPVPALYPKSGVKEPPSTISTADTPAMSFQD